MSVRSMNIQVDVLGSIKEISLDLGAEAIGQGAICSSFKDSEEASRYVSSICDQYLVSVEDGGPSTCIDGRQCLQLESGLTNQVPLSKMAGGNLHTLWVGIELSGSDLLDENDSPKDRVLQTAEIMLSQKQEFAGHSSDHASQDNNECGAAMSLVPSLKAITDQSKAISLLVEALLGEEYDQIIMEDIVSNSSSFYSRLDGSWTGTYLTDAIRETEGKSFIEVLESGDDETHNHHEDGVVFNYVRGKTVDRDSIAKDRQLFWVDMWAIKDLANKFSGGEEKLFLRLLHAMTAIQVATYLALCDGSHQIANVRN